jgi:hypothetical protein
MRREPLFVGVTGPACNPASVVPAVDADVSNGDDAGPPDHSETATSAWTLNPANVRVFAPELPEIVE